VLISRSHFLRAPLHGVGPHAELNCNLAHSRVAPLQSPRLTRKLRADARERICPDPALEIFALPVS
jgi:hypothetical protein